MKVVPVIDLLACTAVHARAGQRHAYRPLQTRGCTDGDALALAKYYTEEFGLDLLYIADLDAIEGRGHQFELLQRLAAGVPNATLWVDAGVRRREDLTVLQDIPGILPVIGSERLLDPTLPTKPGLSGLTVLSLDFAKGGFLGPTSLQHQPHLWPTHTILMDISRVGTLRGPNLARLADYQRRASSVHWFVAGGTRDARDVAALREQGAAGVLLATTLHQGRITRAEIASLTDED